MAKFQKGQSGNPQGRPKSDFCFAAILKNRPKEEYQAVADKVWAMAKAGDLQAANMIWDRLMGKPEQKSKVDLASTSGPLVIAFTGTAPPLWDNEDEDEDDAED